MNFIKILFQKFLRLIDDGRFLVKPMKWFYYLKGIVPFVLPLLFAYAAYENTSVRYYSTWGKFLWWLFVVLFTLYLCIVAYVNFLFWKNRAQKLEHVVRRGDSVVAIPLVADNIKNTGESFGIMLSVVAIVGAIFLYIFLMLSGEEGIYHDGWFIKLLGIIILVSLASLSATYLIILFTHLLSERLRLFAQMCCDLRDVADIHRAAVMLDDDDDDNRLVNKEEPRALE